MFASKHRKYKIFPPVNRRVVPGLSRLSKSLCVLQPSWPLTGVIRALRARNPKKVEKKLPGPFGPAVQKGRKKVENESKTTFFRLFSTFFRLFFNLFLTPGPRGPGNFFSTFLGFRARRARMTPVRGQEGCNMCSKFMCFFLALSTFPEFHSVSGKGCFCNYGNSWVLVCPLCSELFHS